MCCEGELYIYSGGGDKDGGGESKKERESLSRLRCVIA